MSTLARGLLLVALLGSTLVLAGQAASTTVLARFLAENNVAAFVLKYGVVPAKEDQRSRVGGGAREGPRSIAPAMRRRSLPRDRTPGPPSGPPSPKSN
jgi:hypothetical protein